MKMVILNLSLYSLIGDLFMIWRQIKDFKSDVVFSAGFDYDIDTYYIYIFLMHEYVESSLSMFPMFKILHPKLRVKSILRLSKVSD